MSVKCSSQIKVGWLIGNEMADEGNTYMTQRTITSRHVDGNGRWNGRFKDYDRLSGYWHSEEGSTVLTSDTMSLNAFGFTFDFFFRFFVTFRTLAFPGWSWCVSLAPNVLYSALLSPAERAIICVTWIWTAKFTRSQWLDGMRCEFKMRAALFGLELFPQNDHNSVGPT